MPTLSLGIRGKPSHEPRSAWDAAQRYDGVEAACRAAGLESLPPIEVPQTEEAGVALADRLGVLRASERPDAVLCGNDEIALALALVQRLRALGVAVPGTIAVTGWDDVHAARYLSPGLTTVRRARPRRRPAAPAPPRDSCVEHG